MEQGIRGTKGVCLPGIQLSPPHLDQNVVFRLLWRASSDLIPKFILWRVDCTAGVEIPSQREPRTFSLCGTGAQRGAREGRSLSRIRRFRAPGPGGYHAQHLEVGKRPGGSTKVLGYSVSQDRPYVCLLQQLLRAGGGGVSDRRLEELPKAVETYCLRFPHVGTLDLNTWERADTELCTLYRNGVSFPVFGLHGH